MPSLWTATVACLLLLVILGLFERMLNNRAWKAVPIRIHVNGTRGKSTVTRLIWSALREAGIPALAKTTGAAPRLLFPDGSGRILIRKGKPNIREQLRTLWLAKRAGAKAIVIECMALAPDLQWTAEHSMVRATIGVITNARTDHTEVMGATVDQIADCLANTIPRNAVLVVGSRALADSCESWAAILRTKIIVADADAENSWPDENLSIALAVTRQLGIADEIALAGMRRSYAEAATDCPPPYLDARKANDPESFLRVIETLDHRQPNLFIFNHRADRPHRLLNFAANAFSKMPGPQILITGERPAFTSWRALRRIDGIPPFQFVPPRRLPALLSERAPKYRRVVFCGNISGLDLSAINLETPAHG